ncbi:MAG: hypothetical protein FWD87_07645 [Spirochaetaceae bacterium]|nr:hypothetical protein [Spirochaetaceae bacterium]
MRNREKKYSYGNENKDKTFYILGRDWDNGGLMAIVFYSLAHFIYAEKKGYYAIMDLKNYICQYTQKEISEIENAWEYYFKQPFGYSLEDIKNSKNILKQDFVFPKKNYCNDWKYIWEMDKENKNKYMDYLKEKYNKYIRFNTNTKTYLENEYNNILKDKDNVLGVLCRGTDYTKNKPADHPVQPEPMEAIEIVKKIIAEKKCSYIYLATEDNEIYEMFKNHFGSIILSNNQLRYKSDDLIGKKYLNEIPKERRQHDAYTSGLEYLSTLYLLSKCSCFFAGITGGTIAVLCMTSSFEYEYLYYKGLYPPKNESE